MFLKRGEVPAVFVVCVFLAIILVGLSGTEFTISGYASKKTSTVYLTLKNLEEGVSITTKETIVYLPQRLLETHYAELFKDITSIIKVEDAARGSVKYWYPPGNEKQTRQAQRAGRYTDKVLSQRIVITSKKSFTWKFKLPDQSSCGNGILEWEEECESPDWRCPRIPQPGDKFTYPKTGVCSKPICKCMPFGDVPPQEREPRDPPPSPERGATTGSGQTSGTGAGGKAPLYWKDGTPMDGRLCKKTVIPPGIMGPNRYCSAMDDCPDGTVCQSGGSKCGCRDLSTGSFVEEPEEPDVPPNPNYRGASVGGGGIQ